MPNRYKIYAVGTLYVSVCALSLGFIAGMWGLPFMVISLGLMALAGFSGAEFYKNRLSFKKIKNDLDDIFENQEKKTEILKVKLSPAPLKPARPRVKAKKNMPYSDAVTEELIHTAIDKQSVDVFFQPIVRLPNRRVVMMEVFARLRTGKGNSLSASHYMEFAKSKNLQVRLDNLLLRQRLKGIKKDVRQAVRRSYMLNIEENTLTDSLFMEDLLVFLKSNVHLAPRLVFEVTQLSLSAMKKESVDILKALTKLGCGLSMDQVENPQIDRHFMKSIGVKYIKISAERLKGFALNDEGIKMIRRIKSSLAEDKIHLISDKIEDEKTLCEILDLEIDYGQGYLFGKPTREIATARLKKSA